MFVPSHHSLGTVGCCLWCERYTSPYPFPTSFSGLVVRRSLLFWSIYFQGRITISSVYWKNVSDLHIDLRRNTILVLFKLHYQFLIPLVYTDIYLFKLVGVLYFYLINLFNQLWNQPPDIQYNFIFNKVGKFIYLFKTNHYTTVLRSLTGKVGNYYDSLRFPDTSLIFPSFFSKLVVFSKLVLLYWK